MSNTIKNILSTSSKMSDAIRVLQECEQKLVIVIDNERLVGTITDGDIRRGLLNNLNLDSHCSKIMNKDPKYALENEYALMKDLLNKYPFVPIINKDNKVIKIISKSDMYTEQNKLCNVVIEITTSILLSS